MIQRYGGRFNSLLGQETEQTRTVASFAEHPLPQRRAPLELPEPAFQVKERIGSLPLPFARRFAADSAPDGDQIYFGWLDPAAAEDLLDRFGRHASEIFQVAPTLLGAAQNEFPIAQKTGTGVVSVVNSKYNHRCSEINDKDD